MLLVKITGHYYCMLILIHRCFVTPAEQRTEVFHTQNTLTAYTCKLKVTDREWWIKLCSAFIDLCHARVYIYVLDACL